MSLKRFLPTRLKYAFHERVIMPRVQEYNARRAEAVRQRDAERVPHWRRSERPGPKERVRIGVAGAGQYAQHHLKALAAYENVEIAALLTRGGPSGPETAAAFSDPDAAYRSRRVRRARRRLLARRRRRRRRLRRLREAPLDREAGAAREAAGRVRRRDRGARPDRRRSRHLGHGRPEPALLLDRRARPRRARRPRRDPRRDRRDPPADHLRPPVGPADRLGLRQLLRPQLDPRRRPDPLRPRRPRPRAQPDVAERRVRQPRRLLRCAARVRQRRLRRGRSTFGTRRTTRGCR